MKFRPRLLPVAVGENEEQVFRVWGLGKTSVRIGPCSLQGIEGGGGGGGGGSGGCCGSGCRV